MLTNVYESDENEVPKNMIVYTVSDNPDDCDEYLNKMLQVKHKQHYGMWCECHNLDYRCDDSWNKYCADVINDEFNNYLITECYFDAQRIATVFRMFNGCQPLGCNFEQDVEFKYFVDNLNPDLREQIEKKLDEADLETDYDKNQSLN